MDLALATDGLSSRGQVVPFSEIRGFVERYDRWTGALWVEVLGPGWRVPIEPGWGALRAELRAALPDRPFSSAWESGRFPPCPLGLPGDAAFALALVATGAGVATAAAMAGPLAAALVGVVAGWPVARMRDAVVVGARGFSAGPPWAPGVRWDRVVSVTAAPRGRVALIWARTQDGLLAAAVPIGLVPAVRARVQRLGGLALQVGEPDLDAGYAAWRAPARGIPWGLALGTVLAAGFAADPAQVIAIGLGAAAATGVLGAAAEARATGWGFGAIGWLTLLYAAFLALVGIQRVL